MEIQDIGLIIVVTGLFAILFHFIIPDVKKWIKKFKKPRKGE